MIEVSKLKIYNNNHWQKSSFRSTYYASVYDENVQYVIKEIANLYDICLMIDRKYNHDQYLE